MTGSSAGEGRERYLLVSSCRVEGNDADSADIEA